MRKHVCGGLRDIPDNGWKNGSPYSKKQRSGRVRRFAVNNGGGVPHGERTCRQSFQTWIQEIASEPLSLLTFPRLVRSDETERQHFWKRHVRLTGIGLVSILGFLGRVPIA